MINIKDITTAVTALISAGVTATSAITVERNPVRNEDWSRAVDGWIGVYRGSLEYEPHSTGHGYMAIVEILVEIQAASHHGGDDAEDKLADLEKEVIDILKASPTLSGTVQVPLGYRTEYQFNEDEQMAFHAAIITIIAGIRTS